jgi:integration host factor subunit alpha
MAVKTGPGKGGRWRNDVISDIYLTTKRFYLIKTVCLTESRNFRIKEQAVMTLTKAQIIEAFQSRMGFTKNQSADIVESILAIIKQTLSDGEDVLISGFGKFCVNNKQERRGRNPATGEDMMLSPRKVVTFKCSGKLRDKLNGQV